MDNEQAKAVPAWQARALAAYQEQEAIRESEIAESKRAMGERFRANLIETLGLADLEGVEFRTVTDGRGYEVEEATVDGLRFWTGSLFGVTLARGCAHCGLSTDAALICNLAQLGKELAESKPAYCRTCRDKGHAEPPPTLAQRLDTARLHLREAVRELSALVDDNVFCNIGTLVPEVQWRSHEARGRLIQAYHGAADGYGHIGAAEQFLRPILDAEADAQPAEEMGR